MSNLDNDNTSKILSQNTICFDTKQQIPATEKDIGIDTRQTSHTVSSIDVRRIPRIPILQRQTNSVDFDISTYLTTQAAQT